MPGETTTGSLGDSQNVIVQSARIVREEEGVWQRTCDVVKKAKGVGRDWVEVDLAQLTAQDITETTLNENAQELSDIKRSLTPSLVQIKVVMTDLFYFDTSPLVIAKTGQLAGNAIARFKDESYLALFSGMGTTASPGTGNPLSHGHIAAAVANIQGNTTETSISRISTVLHGFQAYDLQSEGTAPLGTYPISAGLTEEFYRRGFKGPVANSNVYTDGNIVLSGTDANGATHASDGVIALQGMELKTERQRLPDFGGGADAVYITDHFVFLERITNWNYRHLSDATAPTS